MAKNKAELNADANCYRQGVSAMRKAHNEGRYLDAIRVALAATEYADGMIQFERRFEKRTDREDVETIHYVFRYAPLLFDRDGLTAVGQLLKSQKRIDKNTAADFVQEVDDAFSLMWDAHRLWEFIEAEREVAQDKLRLNLGGDQDRWRWIAESWEQMGIIRRVPERGSYRISFVTNLTAVVRGKCSECGVVGKAPKGRFLERITCPKCGASATFAILAATSE
jgi:hypothetical protein